MTSSIKRKDKMNIKVLSDLHLEFEKPESNFDPGTGDVLVLAGDICTAIDFEFDTYNMREVYANFFRKCSEGFNKVFYVMGNHEHYYYTFQDTAATLRKYLPENFTLLDNNSEYYEGVHFCGATMWSDWCKRDKDMMSLAEYRMNDYNTIEYMTEQHDHEGPPTLLRTSDVLREHDNTLYWFNQALPTLIGKVVVVTHHAPSYRSISEEYVTRDTIGAYASDVESLIYKYEPELWIHGHIHDTRDYMIGNTRVLCNPRGYPRKDATNGNFDINHEVTI